ncbi:MAG: zinc ABC transporter substrate-binding protein [Arcobacteraceae bacterium]|jgi:zinc transport system substrate-binding protein|nr:zinc ABC transporter substrate-binding protein [Arcobacteraceae bacterium]MDY0365141.1 zinc ABC transporter substrate-binding protein [Arcobacteraceae bacterium]
MKNFIKIVVFGFVLFATSLQAKVNTIVSIVPQKSFVEAIGGDLVNVSVMVLPGSSPHSYEPKPSQMKELNSAEIYFAMGVEFENVWLNKFKNQNKNLKIIDTTKGIEKIDMIEHHHHDEEHKDHHHDHDDEDEDGKDPHIWTSLENIKQIAKNIVDALIEADQVNQAKYQANYEVFIQKVISVDKEIRDILQNTPKNSKFMVFHPAFGYFAKEYGLVQIAVEVEGKEPKPSSLAKLIDEAKEQNIRAIFTQPEFSDKSANIIAKELKIDVIKVSPLNPKWDENLINLAKSIAK